VTPLAAQGQAYTSTASRRHAGAVLHFRVVRPEDAADGPERPRLEPSETGRRISVHGGIGAAAKVTQGFRPVRSARGTDVFPTASTKTRLPPRPEACVTFSLLVILSRPAVE